jgi:2-iminobutanoate/2-iminopropanoate deaminase
MPKQVVNPRDCTSDPDRTLGDAPRQSDLSGGTAALRPGRQTTLEGDIRKQTEATLENQKTTVEAAGGTLADIVKTTIYLGDMADYAGMNEVYRRYFPEAPPARATLITGFVVAGLLVEIEGIAVLDDER